MSDELEPTVRLFSYQDDMPCDARGQLIPHSIAINEVTVTSVSQSIYLVRTRRIVKATLMPVAALAAVALVVFVGNDLGVGNGNVASLPSITIYDSVAGNQTKLTTGPQPALSQAALFTEVRDALIDEGETFIEIDLAQHKVRYFENGVLLLQSAILTAGEPGSWWDMPSGLYEVSNKSERHFSQYTQTYFPWTIHFEGNYMIHGVPEYANGNRVDDTYLGGGVRVDNATVQKLYEATEIGVPVVVRAVPEITTSDFVYEPVGPQITAQQYVVADIENGTVLAAESMDTKVPIASLTKLMTAVIAAEKMNLDKRVYAASPTFVESLIPRLQERGSASMYSLLQLLLLESSNEAAEVIAREYGREAFMEAMNDKAQQIGMFNSQFTDPSGLDAGNVSTVNDLLLLTQYIHKKRDFIFEISANGEAVGVAGGGDFTGLHNFNEIEDNDNFIGGKIGETEAAGKTSVSLHEMQIDGEKRTIVIVLLGAQERDEDIHRLLDFVAVSYD